MPKLLRIFVTGLFISFLGTLPLGTMNIAAMQISVADGLRPALLFALGVLLIEIGYVRLSLVAMNWIRKNQKLFTILEWITLLIIVALAISSFIAASSPGVRKNVVLSGTMHRFLLGVTMSALNPVQIPFWFGWSTVLFTKKVLLPKNSHYNLYIAGIGIGTFAGMCVFVFGGRLLVERLNSNQKMINWIVGGIFAITAIIQAWRMFRKKDVAHQIEHPEGITPEQEKIVEDINTEPVNPQ
ncbi:MAG TPA: LysE family transporter [Chitinophagaceae bacterium]|nr:LysE family transporter [Chitinophagaceae bacterium]